MFARKKYLFLFVLVQLLVVLVGLMLTVLVVQYGKREYRRDLLHHASIAAVNFDPQRLMAVINSPNFSRSAECEAIWQRLHQIQRVISELRQVYLIHRSDQQFRYLANSIVPPCRGGSNEHPLFERSSIDLLRLFKEGQIILHGPFRNGEGEWLMAAVPIVDPELGQVVALFGMDIEAYHYYRKLAIYRFFGVSVTLLLSLLVLTFQISVWRTRKSRDRLVDLNRDLTDEMEARQGAEKSLQAQLHFLQLLLDAIPCPIFYRDIHGVYLGCNQAFETFSGVNKAHLIGRNSDDPVLKELASSYSQGDCELLQLGPGGFRSYEASVSSAEGEQREVIFYKANYISRTGQLAGLVATILDISARKQMESALRASEARLRSIYKNTAAGVLIVDTEGAIAMVNPAFCEFVGYGEDELLGSSYVVVTHPEDLETTAQRYQNVATNKPERFEMVKRYLHKNGSVLWGRVTGNWVYDESHHPIHAIILVVDITEQKRTNDELRSKKELLHNVINHIPESVFWKDCQSYYGGCNKALARQAGFSSPEEIVGRLEHGLPWGKDLAVFQTRDQQVMTSGEPMFGLEEIRQFADGRQVTVLTSRVPLRDDEGAVVGMLGIFSDITKRKQAEQALKQSEQDYKKLYQEFQAVLDAMPETIMLIAPDMTVEWANRGALRQFKHCSSLSDQYCFEAWRGLEAPCQGCPVKRCFVSGEAEEEILHDSEGRTWVVRAYPLKDEQGTVINVIDVARDISEKIRMRAETDRHSRLASLGELAAGVAHEINNPNGLILLNIPVVQEVFSDALKLFERCYQQDGTLELAGLDYPEVRDEVPQMLRRIQDGAVRIKRIVEDLKNFVRQGNQNMAAHMDLNEVARAATRLLENTIKKSTDHFEMSLGGLPCSRGDFQRIEQVVVNLLHNACQALPSRSHRIQMLTAYNAEKQCNVLTIKDEGRGIAPELLPRVTDPFFTTKRQQGGTGLGLSISARIVKEHGGHLEIQSQLFRGTEVTIELPIAEKEDANEESVSTTADLID